MKRASLPFFFQQIGAKCRGCWRKRREKEEGKEGKKKTALLFRGGCRLAREPASVKGILKSGA